MTYKSISVPILSNRLLRFRRLLATEQGSLMWLWLLRFFILLLLTVDMLMQRKILAPLNLYMSRGLLLALFIFLVISGIGGVYFTNTWLRWPIRFVQGLIEIVLYSLCIIFFPRSEAPLWALYLIPFIAAIRFLRPALATIVVMTGLAAATVALMLRYDALSFGLEGLYYALPLALITLLMIALRRPAVQIGDLRDEAEGLRQILERYDSGVFVVNAQQRLRFVNAYLAQRHGPLVPGTLCYDYFTCREKACLGCHFATSGPADPAPQPYNCKFIDQGGLSYDLTAQCQRLPDEQAERSSVVFLRTADASEVELHTRLPTLFADLARLLTDLVDSKQELGQLPLDDKVLDGQIGNIQRWFRAESAALFILEGGRLVRKSISGIEGTAFPEEYTPGGAIHYP